MPTLTVSPQGTTPLGHPITVARTRLFVAELALDRALKAWDACPTDATALGLDSAILTLAVARALFAEPCTGDSLWDRCPMHDEYHGIALATEYL